MQQIGIIGAGWLMSKWIENRAAKFTITTRSGIPSTPSRNVFKTIAYEVAAADKLSYDDWQEVDYIVVSVPFSGRNTLEVNMDLAINIVENLIPLNKPTIVLTSTGVYSSAAGTYSEESAQGVSHSCVLTGVVVVVSFDVEPDVVVCVCLNADSQSAVEFQLLLFLRVKLQCAKQYGGYCK